MRRTAHFALVMLGNLPLLLAYAGVTLAACFYIVADKVWPDADRGNCWSYAMARAWREGGHVAMRMVRGVPIPMPHVAWVHRLGADAVQTDPVERYTGWRGLVAWAYFRFSVRGEDSKPSPAWRKSMSGDL